jgi:hypothetical protein
MMIEFSDPLERIAELKELIGIADRVVYIKVNNHDLPAIADEDLDRETDEKTAALHFLRFELARDMVAALRDGAPLNMGIGHAAYSVPATPVDAGVRNSLASDLDTDATS